MSWRISGFVGDDERVYPIMDGGGGGDVDEERVYPIKDEKDDVFHP